MDPNGYGTVWVNLCNKITRIQIGWVNIYAFLQDLLNCCGNSSDPFQLTRVPALFRTQWFFNMFGKREIMLAWADAACIGKNCLGCYLSHILWAHFRWRWSFCTNNGYPWLSSLCPDFFSRRLPAFVVINRQWKDLGQDVLLADGSGWGRTAGRSRLFCSILAWNWTILKAGHR